MKEIIEKMREAVKIWKDLGDELPPSPHCETCEYKPYGYLYCEQAMEEGNCPEGRKSIWETVEKYSNKEV